MFSATKFIVAGAIVALFGGFLLAGVLTTQPTQPQPPAASTESTVADRTIEPNGEFSGRVNFQRQMGGSKYAFRPWEMSDPRLDGEWVILTTESWIPSDSVPEPRVYNASFRIENEDGAWEELPSLELEFADGTSSTKTSVLIGEGDYEGLTAIVELTHVKTMGSAHYDVRGVVTSGELPPPPSHTLSGT